MTDAGGTSTGPPAADVRVFDSARPLSPANNPFESNVKVTFTDIYMVVQSDGIPNHPHGDFPNATNPNSILKQNYRFLIPLHPHYSSTVTPTPFGPIGVAINGIPFYNQYDGQGRDAVKYETFDSCCGHPDEQGRYHYHKYPVCIHSPFHDPKGQHSPIIGYAFDGFPIYGPNDDNGKPAAGLDSCNGEFDKIRGYHYHVTAGYPYILGGYHGTPATADFDHGRPGGGMDGPRGPNRQGGPGGWRPPPPWGGPPPPFGPPG
jgi:hypothetical protein